MGTIAVQTSPDGVLAAVMPLGLAAAHTTALVIDLDPSGVRLPGRRTLADLVREEPSAEDLHPRRSGLAVLPNGGVEPADALEVVGALREGWPTTVIRLPDETFAVNAPGIGVRPVLPGLRLPALLPAVLQPTGLAPVPPDLPGLVLPMLTGRVARSLLAGARPRSRWIQACGDLWDLT